MVSDHEQLHLVISLFRGKHWLVNNISFFNLDWSSRHQHYMNPGYVSIHFFTIQRVMLNKVMFSSLKGPNVK